MKKIVNYIGAGFLGFLLVIGIIIIGTFPLYWLWNWLAPIYLNFLPLQWLHIPYTHFLGLLGIIFLIKIIIFSKTDFQNKK